jgi:recombination protein RecT
MAAAKAEALSAGNQQASLIVNNGLIDGLVRQLKEKENFGLTFPKDYNVANALTGAYLILKETVDKDKRPVLESCSQASIVNSLMEMATLALNVNKKQGYFIAYGGKCQFQKSYFGNITLAKRNGLKKISAEIIYEGDTFKYHIVNGEKVIDEHTQDFMNIDNDKIKGAYAVAKMMDGSQIVEIMNINQLKKAWNQRMGGLKEDAASTHTKFKDQMSKKTVINRLCKMIANTSTDGNISEISDRLDQFEDISPIEIEQENVAYEIKNEANSETFVEPATGNRELKADADGQQELPAFMQ